MIAFEVQINGQQKCTAGIAGPRVLTAALTWVLRNPAERRLRRKELLGYKILQVVCALGVLGMSAASAQDVSQKPRESKTEGGGFAIPTGWTRRGLVLERQHKDKGVSGDPCIVWDDAVQGWRMVLFYDPPGHAQAVCTNRDDPGPGHWKLEG